MSAKRQSWKDVIQERQKESFVGRADYLKQFSGNFASEIPNYLLFFVIGEGGVGKSTLLKQFETIEKNSEIDAIIVTCDNEQSSPVSAMGYIAEQLAKFGINTKEFNERYKTYRARRDEIESDSKAPRGALNLVVRGMTDFAIKAGRRAPGIGVFAEYIDEKEAGDALTQGVNYLVDRIGNKDEIQLLREPERILTPLFIELLNKACEKHRLVLMFDVFERTREALEPWLLDFLDFKFGEFDTGTTFVISGRDTVDQRWTQIASSICYITLEPFTFEETRSYLRFRRITNKQLVMQIFEDTGGLPVLVELLAGTNPKPGSPLPDISKDAVKRFLQWIPEEERRWVVLLAAVPRNFNLDILSAALGTNANNDFNWLSVQSYIRTSTSRGWFYHEKVRELMLRFLRSTKPGDLTIIHNRLKIFFEEQEAKVSLATKTAHTNIAWWNFEIERIYHLLNERPNSDLSNPINTFLYAFRWKWEFSSGILEILKQVTSETGDQGLENIVKVLEKFFHAYEKDRDEELISVADLLIRRNDLDTIAQATLLYYRGDSLRRIGKHEKALADFSSAISLDGEYTRAMAHRGYTYRQMGDYEKALVDFDDSINIDKDYLWGIHNRGITYRLMGKYEQAVADFDRVITLNHKHKWAYANRGLTYRLMGENEKALADYNSAISIDENYAWVIVNRGSIYLFINKYE